MTGREDVAPPTWRTWREAVRVVVHPVHLAKTARVALIVGTVLFTINQLDVVLSGRATREVWLKSALTFVVPLCVSSWGILIATRRKESTTVTAEMSVQVLEPTGLTPLRDADGRLIGVLGWIDGDAYLVKGDLARAFVEGTAAHSGGNGEVPTGRDIAGGDVTAEIRTARRVRRRPA